MLRLSLIIILLISCSKKTETEPEKHQVKSIAKLAAFKKDVEYKKKNIIEWKTVTTGLDFHAYDRVKTGHDSSAQVVFYDHSELNIHADSIAIIIDRVKSKEDLSILEINKGKVEGKLLGSTDGQKVLEVRNKLKKFKLKNKTSKPNSFEIQIKQEKIEVKSLDKNQVVIEVDKKEYVAPMTTTEITSNEVKVLDVPTKSKLPNVKKEKLKPFYKLLSPTKDFSTDSQTIIISGETYGYQVILNGNLITNSGVFKNKFKLNPGLNILTFQFVRKDEVKFKVIKVTLK